MINNRGANFLSRHDPDLHQFRTRLTRAVIVILYILLAILLLLDLAIAFLKPADESYQFGFDFAAIAVLALIGLVALRLLNKDRVDLAGYLLGSLIFAGTFAGTWLFPQDLPLISAGFLLAIMLVGSIVGGRTGYPFAALAFLATTTAWYRANELRGGFGGPFDDTSGITFIFTQTILYFGLAALLHVLSRYIHQTIERLHSHTEQLTQLAHTDPLTGLANRRLLIEQLEREFLRAHRYKRPLSLVYIDLDGFKQINDRYGHIFGDEVLRKVALSMRAALRSADLFPRIGGDEFAILLPETTINSSQDVIKKLRKALSAFGQNLDPAVPSLSFCAGVGQLRSEDQSIDDLLTRADEAQYRAKDAGKGQTRTQLDFDQLPLFDSSPKSDTLH